MYKFYVMEKITLIILIFFTSSYFDTQHVILLYIGKFENPFYKKFNVN